MNQIRHNWEPSEILALLQQPFNDLLYQAQQVHRHYFNPNAVQISTLLSIKTGGCPEDCAYCPQSLRYQTRVEKEELLALETVIASAKQAKANGASRFCMGAAWRRPKDKELAKVIAMIKAVKALGLETCATLGMLEQHQAQQLKQAGLDYYNHNLDTSPEYYGEIISTRTYEYRLQTLEYVRSADISVCCGGIVGMGESIDDRVSLLQQLANLPKHPESVPINLLVKVAGTPLAEVADFDPIDFVRMIAVARILMPKSMIRLSAGREKMDDALQALCFFAGANSLFYGEKLLTTDNPAQVKDQQLMQNLGLTPQMEQHCGQ